MSHQHRKFYFEAQTGKNKNKKTIKKNSWNDHKSVNYTPCHISTSLTKSHTIEESHNIWYLEAMNSREEEQQLKIKTHDLRLQKKFLNGEWIERLSKNREEEEEEENEQH